MPACGRFPLRWSRPRQATTYRDRRSIAILVAHPANEVAGSLRLDRHGVGHRAERRDINPLAGRLYRSDLCHGLAPARDAHRITGCGSLDELTQMRLGGCEIDAQHFRALDYLVGHL